MTDCIFDGNAASGLYLQYNSSPVCNSCTMSNNNNGLYMYESYCSPTLDDCTMTGNAFAGINFASNYFNATFTNVTTSNNLYGYYVYNVSNSWEMLVENYIPDGETYGVPSSLAIKTGPDDAVYVLAPTSSKAQYQIYRYNKDAATKLEPFAGPVQVTPGSSGAVKETMCFGINPTTGEIVGAYIMDSKLYFAVIDENRQWTEFKEVEGAKPAAAGDSIALAFAPDGTGYIAVVAKVEDVSSIELYKIGLEADFLPE